MKREELLSRLEHRMMLIGRGMHEEQSKKSKSSPAQNHLLMIMCNKDEMTVKQLADLLNVTSGAITQHVDALEKAGLVQRETNYSNRREVFVKVTEEGRAAFQKFRGEKTKALGKLFGDLSDDELKTLVELIDKVSQKYVKSKGGGDGKVQ